MSATGLVNRPANSSPPPTTSSTPPIQTCDSIGGGPPAGIAIGQPKSFIVPACTNRNAATILSTLCRYPAMIYPPLFTMGKEAAAIDALYVAESRRVLATLIRLLGDFDLAEEALHEAFRAALEQWPRDGMPANPRAWLVSAGRFKAVDALRRRARFDPLEEEHAETLAAEDIEKDEIEDDRLRLMFTCCHPALSQD